jgi:hypothetical protein
MATEISSPLLNALSIQQKRVFLAYAKSFASNCQGIGEFRTLLEFRDRAYQMQLDQSAERIKQMRSFMTGSARRKITDIQVPIVMPQIESAVAYQAGVYLSSYPIFGVIATAQNQSQADQFETVIGNHSLQYGWARELIKVFRDGFKYNFGVGFAHWKKTKQQKIATSTEISKAGLASMQSTTYGGNCITRIDPYNCFMDMRVDPAKHHEEGEAFGWNQLMSRITFKRFVENLDPTKCTQLKEAFESGYQGAGGQSYSALDYYLPIVNPYLNVNQLAMQGTNWMAWSGLDPQGGSGRSDRISYKSFYLISYFICRALPSDFGKQGNIPTIYFGIIVNWQVVIYVEELISANDYLPVFIMQPNEDGLGYQTQSMLDTALPFQDMSSALWNISLESKRRLVFDRLIYNERFINKADIDPASAVARIPLRNASQFKGDDIGKAVYQIPYREDNSASNLQMSEMISQMADTASGQNKVDRGQFQKGNKTKTEFDTTMANSNARQQLTSLTIENQFMTPLKDTIKSNLLLNQQPGTYLNRSSKTEVKVDPVAMRQSLLEFKLTDGLLPGEKMLNTELMTVFIQTAQAMPVVMTEYDIVGMFIYWCKLKGANWIDEFKRDPAQQQEFLQQFQQTSMAQNAQPPQEPVAP